MNQTKPIGTTGVGRVMSANLRRMRDVEGLRQSDVAAYMALRGHALWKPHTVAAVETGRRQVTVDELADLVAVVGDLKGLLSCDKRHTGFAVDQAAKDRCDALVKGWSELDPWETDDARVELLEVRQREAMEKRAAKALGIAIDELREVAEVELYGHDIWTEREQRLGEFFQLKGASLSDVTGTRRWITRDIYADIRELLGIDTEADQ